MKLYVATAKIFVQQKIFLVIFYLTYTTKVLT